MPFSDKTIGFIGAGAMAEAITSGLVGTNLISPHQIWAADINKDRLQYLKGKLNIQVTPDNPELVGKSDIVVLAVKPFIIKEVMEQIAPLVRTGQLIISIAAGQSIGYIQSFFTEQVSVIRVMPNTPALVSQGATAIAAGENVTAEDIALAQKLFGVVGRTVVVREQDMDAVTGLSGSGPAYMYIIIEALSDAGVKAGLPRQVALNLAAQTMYGAAKMVLETGEHPAVLKDKVTTPGGTTITGLHILEQGKVRATFIDAVMAAVEKSRDLGAARK